MRLTCVWIWNFGYNLIAVVHCKKHDFVIHAFGYFSILIQDLGPTASAATRADL